MKLAFVSYPAATLLPPYYGSMGASTFMSASSLSTRCKVLVYGLQDSQRGAASTTVNGVEYRFIPSTKIDRVRHKLRTQGSRLVSFKRPISVSSSLYPGFGDAVARELSREHCDVIHIQHCPQYIPAIRKQNPESKIVIHLHAEMYSQMNYSALRRWFRDADWIFTVSDYVTEQTRRTFPEFADRCETMHDAIDLSEFSREKSYSTSSGKKKVLYAGGAWPHKGAHVVLEAFARVAQQYLEVHLDMVGPQGAYPMEECFDLADKAAISKIKPFFRRNRLAWLRAKLAGSTETNSYLAFLKAQVKSIGADKVTFRGFVSRPELIDYYYNADVFVFPPIWNEPFGCTPLEAMAAGVPVVVSRSGGILETVQDRKTGFWVNKDDSEALAERMLQLLKNDSLREEMGRAGRKRAFEKFDWRNVGESMFRRYCVLAKSGSISDQGPTCAEVDRTEISAQTK